MGIKGLLPPNIRNKIVEADRRPLGKAGMTTEENIDAKRTKDEKADHKRVMAWVARNELKCIHAPTFRRVHDLPPGWPDFTLIWGDQHLFVELKSARGRLSPAQLEMKAKLEAQGATVYVKFSYESTKRLMIGWLWEVARWRPLEPE
jgi:VRR-NUC domain